MIPRIFVLAALAASIASAGVVRRDVAEQALILPTESKPDTTTILASVSYDTISPDGSCGGETGYTCEDSAFGNCCSIYGYCGSTEAFCGTNCFTRAGLCSGTSEEKESSSEQAPATTTPMPMHTPWKPTVQHPPKFKPSYKIDNDERAPNQVWN